jgi:cytochrome c
MRLSRSPEPLSREARRETGLQPSREGEPSPRTGAGTRAAGPHHAAPPALRRREKYAAAVLLAAAISAALAETAWAGGLAGDPNRGETLYEACQDCHSLDKNDVGPRHRGVFGRKAASLPDYDYSDALKSANIVWNEETLDKWLTDPQAVAPGAKMFFHADVIAYLKERAK